MPFMPPTPHTQILSQYIIPHNQDPLFNFFFIIDNVTLICRKTKQNEGHDKGELTPKTLQKRKQTLGGINCHNPHMETGITQTTMSPGARHRSLFCIEHVALELSFQEAKFEWKKIHFIENLFHKKSTHVKIATVEPKVQSISQVLNKT